jgi:hypothetical protein
MMETIECVHIWSDEPFVLFLLIHSIILVRKIRLMMYCNLAVTTHSRLPRIETIIYLFRSFVFCLLSLKTVVQCSQFAIGSQETKKVSPEFVIKMYDTRRG